MRSIWLIAKSVLIEAVRRKEIYTIVLLSLILIAGILSINFFELKGLSKFYREVALRIMSLATALTVIVLSCRQLPREFENRTIYPLLAKPVNRFGFLSGKLLGVLLAAAFCFSLFMIIFTLGTLYLRAPIPWIHFLEYFYLQMWAMAILATLGFFLSLIMNLDAAITMGILFFVTADILINGISYIYDFMGTFGKTVLTVMTFALPQLSLFDFSGKTIHSDVWPPLGLSTLGILTLYAMVFTGVYFLFSILLFRRRAL